jgi:hypothetical protein
MEPSRRPTRKLFKEYHPDGGLSIEDWHRTFVGCADPTEYRAAILLAGSWEEWERFKKEWPDFRVSILPAWKAEVEVKLRSDAIFSVVKQALDDPVSARWIAEGKYKPAKPKTKVDAEAEKKIRKKVADTAQEEIDRVMGTSA